MALKTHHIVASYDIHDSKRLQRVARAMKNYGDRVLKSVFECNLTDVQFQKMKNQVEALIDHTEDSVRYYFLCDKCIENVDFSGLGRDFIKDRELIIT